MPKYLFPKGHKINVGKKHTKEHNRKISEAMKGKPTKIPSKETRLKMRLAKLGKKQIRSKEGKISFRNKMKGHQTSEETRKKIGEKNKISMKKFYDNGGVSSMKGKKYTENQKQGWRLAWIKRKEKGLGNPWNKGKTKKQDNRIAQHWLEKRGENHPAWKGGNGISSEMEKIRHSPEMRLWRKAVLERDNFTCQKYKTRGGNLVIHHINNFAEFPELRTSIENGITLSEKAHQDFHKLYGKENNTREQLNEFLKNDF